MPTDPKRGFAITPRDIIHDPEWQSLSAEERGIWETIRLHTERHPNETTLGVDVIPPYSLVTSYKQLAELCNCRSVDKVKRTARKLHANGWITTLKRHRRGVVITATKAHIWQDSWTYQRTQTTLEVPLKRTQSALRSTNSNSTSTTNSPPCSSPAEQLSLAVGKGQPTQMARDFARAFFDFLLSSSATQEQREAAGADYRRNGFRWAKTIDHEMKRGTDIAKVLSEASAMKRAGYSIPSPRKLFDKYTQWVLSGRGASRRGREHIVGTVGSYDDPL